MRRGASKYPLALVTSCCETLVPVLVIFTVGARQNAVLVAHGSRNRSARLLGADRNGREPHQQPSDPDTFPHGQYPHPCSTKARW